MIIDWRSGPYSQLSSYQFGPVQTYSLSASLIVAITYGIQKTRRAYARARGRM